MNLLRWLIIGAVAVIIAAFLLMRSSDVSTKGDIVLYLGGWSAGDAENQMVKKQIALFEQAHPGVEVKVETVTQNFDQYMQSNIAAGTEPDIFYVGFDLNNYVKRGLLLPLDKYLPADVFKDYYPTCIEGCTINGHVYALPKEIGTLLLYYNPEMFAAAGISAPPDTWQDLLVDCRKLELAGQQGKLGKDFRRPICVDGKGAGTFLFPFIYQAGGHIYDEKTNKLVYDQPDAKQAFSFFFEKLMRENKYSDQANNFGAPDTATAFAQKRCAMVFNGTWMSLHLGGIAPGWNYGMAMLPKDKIRAGSIFYGSYAMGRNCKHPQLAAELIRFLTGPEAGWVVAETGIGLPASPSSAAEYKRRYPRYAAVVDMIPFCVMAPLGKKGGMVCDEFNRIYGNLLAFPDLTIDAELKRSLEAIKNADKHDKDYNWN